jgi:hypothetical protein
VRMLLAVLLLAGCTHSAPPRAHPETPSPSATPAAYAAWPVRGTQAGSREARNALDRGWASRGALDGETRRVLYLGYDPHAPVAVFLRTAAGHEPSLVLARQPNAADCVVVCYAFCVAPLPPAGTPVSWLVPRGEGGLRVLAPPGARVVRVSSGGETTTLTARDGLWSAPGVTHAPYLLSVDGRVSRGPTFAGGPGQRGCLVA